MKLFTIIFSVMVLAAASGWATPVRIIDGKPFFAKSQVNGLPAWNQSDEDDLVQTYGNGTLVQLTPANFEVNLSTTLILSIDGTLEIKFDNHDDWDACQTRAGLRKKIRKVRALIDSMSDLPVTESAELRQRAGWLKAYYLSLP